MKYIFYAFFACSLFSCNRVKHTVKEGIHQGGQLVSEGSSEFAEGIKTGIDKVYGSHLTLSTGLEQKGIKPGKFQVTVNDSATIFSVYLIFEKDINQPVTLTVKDQKGQEYGRSRQILKAAQGDARYVDFLFDKRTRPEDKSEYLLSE